MDRGTEKTWLLYLVGAVGVILSILGWLTLRYNINLYLESLHAIRQHLPWIALVLGLSISCLIVAIIRMTLLARHRAQSLHLSNESLKKEISVKLKLEESKQKLEVALLQGQKLQAMGTLASGIAHDFNNLLYAIIGYTQLSQQDIDKNSHTYQNLGKILEASKRGQELVARILAFSRRQHHALNVLNLTETIEAALSLLRPTVPASVIIENQFKSTASILGNKTQIHQVLVNLINNAVDAMDGEGHILIETADIDTSDPVMTQFPAKPGEQYCKIEISDTGHGMDQQTIERIFEPFYTTKEVGKGTGLGMSIVHNIIEEHRGDIIVSSQLGRGTTIVLLLPIHQGSTQGDE